MSKPTYQAGDWFAVPLHDGGYATGIVVSRGKQGIVSGHFFGPRKKAIPAVTDLAGLVAEEAILSGHFSDMHLATGKWPLLGHAAMWDEAKWRIPFLIRYEELTGRNFRVYYDVDDPNRVIAEELVTDEASTAGPRDGLMGAAFVEELLNHRLR